MSTPASLATAPAAVALPPVRRERTLARSALLLTGAMGIAGLLTYAFLVLAARTLGPSPFGEIGALWGGLYIASIVLFRPLEQTTSRAIADRRSRGEEGWAVMRSTVLMGLAIAGLVLVAGAASWSRISDGLFHGDNVMTALLVAGVVFYGASFLVRGLVGGVMWFDGYGVNVLADATSRLLIGLPLLVLASKDLAALAVVCAGLGGALAPLALGRRRLRRALDGTSGESFHIGRAVAFAGPASTIAAADQLLISGGPLLIIAGGGHGAGKAAGVAFAVTMLVRAPVYIFQGVAAALLPNFTQVQAGDRSRQLWQATIAAARIVAAAGLVTVAAVAVAGPTVSRIFYGSSFATTRSVLVWLAAGVAFYLVAATLSQSLLALDAAPAAAVSWLTSAAVFVIGYVALPGTHLSRLSVGFAVATFVLLALLLATLYRRIGRGGP